MVLILIGAIIAFIIGIRRAQIKLSYAKRFAQLWKAINALATQMSKGGYSLTQQMAALREMQSMARECEYIARVVLKKPDVLRDVTTLQADLERGNGLLEAYRLLRPHSLLLQGQLRIRVEAKLSTAEFRAAANKRCGMSRAMFYRLLKKGRKELRFRQRDGTSGPWEAV